jgi:phosphoribosylglycinamide formyltransferase-1
MERVDSGSQTNRSVKHIALFASGNGSNAKKIIEYFSGNEHIIVKLVVCNKPGAGVIKIAHEYDIPLLMIEKDRFFRGDSYLNELRAYQIEFIVLAGFLWKIPGAIIMQYKNKIINIHPALLPKYGGKGMYGANVHQAVLDAHDTESGITIHYVDEQYDHGDVIFQAKCPVLTTDSAESLAERIHRLEHENFPRIIEECINRLG